MSLEIKIHNAQLLILRELLFHPNANYAKLQKPTGLTSDHFNFHITKLIELGFVERVEKGLYRLTVAGKEYANKLDTDNNTIERQPKMAVMLFLTKKLDGKTYFLIQQRTKNPNYGFFGFPTGKVRWGETLIQSARRELMEETGLDANFEVRGAYHEHTFLDMHDEPIEDKLFFICKASNISGHLKPSFEGGKNQWLTLAEFRAQDKRFKSIDSELDLLHNDTWLIERRIDYDGGQF